MAPVLEQVLEWVNSERRHFDESPLPALPKGIPGDGDECVIARALGANCGLATYTRREADLDDQGIEDLRWIPEPVSDFIIAFDRGEYPELLDGLSDA